MRLHEARVAQVRTVTIAHRNDEGTYQKLEAIKEELLYVNAVAVEIFCEDLVEGGRAILHPHSKHSYVAEPLKVLNEETGFQTG